MKRDDDYSLRRARLKDLSDEQLRERFRSLAKELTDPLLQMGREYTSPSIERSVLLRMGFSSQEAAALVNLCLEHALLGHGAGNVVYRYSQSKGLGIREAGLALLNPANLEEAARLFGGKQ